MKKEWMALALAALVFGGGPVQAQSVSVPSGWALDWHDEFDGTALDHGYQGQGQHDRQ